MRYSEEIVRSRQRGAKGLAGSARRRRRGRDGSTESDGPAFYVQPVGDAPAANGSVGPDLLHESPRAWGDLSGAAELVRFAYEGGDCAGVFDTVIDATPVAPSSFDPAAFAPQLYFADLLRRCFRIEIDGTPHAARESLLARILSAPPSDIADVLARQAVFRDLAAEPALRSDLERIYVAVRRLRSALEAGRSEEPSAVRRKLSVLEALRDCIDALADGFGGTGTLLGRLRASGEAMRDGEHYQRLVELLDFDDHMATVDVRLRLGSDGVMRGFAITAIQENTGNTLLPGPVARFFQRVGAFFRGYRYSENHVVVRLLDEVFQPFVEATVFCLALTGAIEFYLAGLSFRDFCTKHGLETSLPELVGGVVAGEDESDETRTKSVDPPTRLLEDLFNPLLFLQDVVPVPCDVPIPSADALTLITGPNSGGKTRLLQAIALAQCLGQVGLFVPARRARLVLAPGLFVSLVIEQDAAQREGRLGTELLRIRQLFEELEPGALAIIDELCSGTNPMEGEAIFEMVVSLLPRLSPQCFISTHFLGLADRLEREPPVEGLAFLEVELDADERPTFRFVPGVAKTSLAHKVASRLGVTREELEKLVAQKAK